MRDKLL
jgi:hypothetical protein